jgi:magnesium chelatase family protein
MLARVITFAVDGVDARRVCVEADIRLGLPAFTVVGLADKGVREARERVRAAMVNSGYEFPLKRITVNLAPAYLRKVGPAFDLPLAVALLIASGQLDPATVEGCAVIGELSLTGEVRPVIPLRPGISRSTRTQSYEFRSRAATAVSPSGQMVTSCPMLGSSTFINSCSDRSSSAKSSFSL